MSSYVRRIQVHGLFGRFDLHKEFASGVNVIYGRNGSGKTLLLHILANILNGDYDRFAFLEFRSISLEFDDQSVIKIERRKDRDDITGAVDSLILVKDGESTEILSVNEIEVGEPALVSNYKPTVRMSEAPKPILPVIYFPAFRTAIEAWKSVQVDSNMHRLDQVTHFARCWLLPFVPRVDCPALSQVKRGLVEISANSDDKDRVERYLKCVNSFLEGKMLVVNSSQDVDLPPVDLRFDDGFRASLDALSSGERQIVTLMYAATQVDSHKVLLIDEPEISLHVTWQRMLLREMAALFQQRQIIACTHSPVIRADYPDTSIKLMPASDEETPL